MRELREIEVIRTKIERWGEYEMRRGERRSQEHRRKEGGRDGRKRKKVSDKARESER